MDGDRIMILELFLRWKNIQANNDCIFSSLVSNVKTLYIYVDLIGWLISTLHPGVVRNRSGPQELVFRCKCWTCKEYLKFC